MKLSNKCYDILKWVAVIGFPAIGFLYTSISKIWGLPFTSEVVQTLDIVGTVLGLLIGISTAEYNKEKLKIDE